MIRWLQLSWECTRMIALKLHNEDIFTKEKYSQICEFFDKVLEIDNQPVSRVELIKLLYCEFKDKHKSRVELVWSDPDV